MILESVTVTSLNSKVIEGILTLIPQAAAALKENNTALFIDITNSIQTCAEHTYSSLQNEIKDHIFDVSWDVSLIEDGNQEKIASLADKWAVNISASCKRHLI